MNKIEEIKKILLLNNIKEQEDILFELIPELKFEDGFDQKSPWHSYDVWNHTLVAINSCDNNFEDRLILLLHDIGKPFSYQDDGNQRHFKNHAIVSGTIAHKVLIDLGFDEEKAFEFSSIISNHATKIKLDDINEDNINYYKRLLKIQKCDGSAYEEEHSKLILEQLNILEMQIKEFKTTQILKKSNEL